MKRAFTLIELAVSVGILALVISFAGVVFRIGIESHRVAGANTEIMQKLRAITDQLNADFKGIRRDAPLLLRFQTEVLDPNQRYDQVMFFSNGGFQSTQVYGPNGVPSPAGVPVRGSVARLYYGQGVSLDRQGVMQDPRDLLEEDRVLARRQHISSADTGLFPFPDVTDITRFTDTLNPSGLNQISNDAFEHDSIPLSQWKRISNDPNYNNWVAATCLGSRPWVDLQNMTGVHMLVAQQVGSLAIQWAYSSPEGLRWWPSSFDIVGTAIARGLPAPEFGIYFNMPGGLSETSDWYWPEEVGSGPNFFPEALKFTFTLYDSRGILEGGRTFTHIVYLGD